MREIKFRAWDEGEKRFWYFTLQDILERRMVYRGSWDEKVARYEKTQYTGLKDKNGVDIYEGDLLEGYDPDTGETIRPLLGVYWSSRGMWDCESFILGGMNESCEVIGNIYEHPHL